MIATEDISLGQSCGAQAASGGFGDPKNTPFFFRSQPCGAQAASGGFGGPKITPFSLKPVPEASQALPNPSQGLPGLAHGSGAA